MREEKAQKYKELKNQRNSKEFESWFLRYVPFEDQMEKEDQKLISENKKLKKQTKKYKPKRENKKKRKSRKSRKNIIELFNAI
jgi:sugar-specific transcriptional regulator TrmB